MRQCRVLSLLFLAVALLPGPAVAQYLFLDANGDGVRTAADVLHPTAATAVDVWLVLDRNRDGSIPTCSTNPSTPLNFFSYGFCLRAVGGTVAYADFVNQVATMPVSFGTAANETEFFAGAAAPRRTRRGPTASPVSPSAWSGALPPSSSPPTRRPSPGA